MRFYPFKFEPIFKARIWGGQKLREVFGKNIPADAKIGESWELADLPQDKSVIVNGELAGLTLAEAIARYPAQITGDAGFCGRFPLLIKLLDAEDILSVQVHPDAETCRRMGKGDPKTECWYVISAAPGAFIYKGLKKGVTRGDFADAIRRGEVAELLEKVPVEAGQCHFLPAGTPHSIGPGLLIAEIQTPSETTYRVFDFNRVDERGRARELHIEEALESIHFDGGAEELPVTTAGRLVDCEYFKIDKMEQAEGSEVPLAPGEVRVLVIIAGYGAIEGAAGGCVEFAGGQTLLLPAVCEGRLRCAGETTYLTVTI